jgi:hypothetical protein
MISRKHKAVPSFRVEKASASNFVRQHKLYQKAFPIGRKFDYMLGIALLSLQNPANTKQSKSQLLSVVEELLTLKANLGLFGGTNHD